MKYDIGTSVVYKNTLQKIERTDIGSSSGELYLEPAGLWVNCDLVKPAYDYSEYQYLVKGGVVCSVKEELCFLPFAKSIPESAPQEVINHWLEWLNGEQEYAV